MEELDGHSEKNLVETTISLLLFLFLILFYQIFFSEIVENFISHKMSHQKFESGKNYRFFIGIKICLLIPTMKLFTTHFIRDGTFHSITKKNSIKNTLNGKN